MVLLSRQSASGIELGSAAPLIAMILMAGLIARMVVARERPFTPGIMMSVMSSFNTRFVPGKLNNARSAVLGGEHFVAVLIAGLGDELANRFFVFDDQDHLAPALRDWRRTRGRSGSFFFIGQRKEDLEPGANAFFGLHL
jgi:hypothetical protein